MSGQAVCMSPRERRGLKERYVKASRGKKRREDIPRVRQLQAASPESTRLRYGTVPDGEVDGKGLCESYGAVTGLASPVVSGGVKMQQVQQSPWMHMRK